MNRTVSDSEIRIEMILRAPREKVWAALTTPEGWTGWFSEEVRSDFSPGSTIWMGFGAYGECQGVVTERVEGQVFAVKWHAGGEDISQVSEDDMTEMRFTLNDSPDGTLLTLVESGFDKLPMPSRIKSIELNTSGWASELAELRDFVENDQRQPIQVDKIVRERFILAPVERVWSAIATADGLRQWWLKGVSGNLDVGSRPTLEFSSETSGVIEITERREHVRFALRWPARGTDVWTTVAFDLASTERGTRIEVREEGFAEIPEAHRAEILNEQREGWTIVMNSLVEHLERD